MPVRLVRRWLRLKNSFFKVNSIRLMPSILFVKDSNQLCEYEKKRDFTETSEPLWEISESSDKPIFVIHKHDASHLHYDLRLESQGVLKSWAVPKGPSMDPKVKRLAIPTEDHPMAYVDFEGVIPEGNYGAGTVIVWDSGTYRNVKEDGSYFSDNLESGHATIHLEGFKLHGGFALIRTGRGGNRPQWLFFKMKDEYARPGSDITSEEPDSSKTGRSLEEVSKTETPTDLSEFE